MRYELLIILDADAASAASNVIDKLTTTIGNLGGKVLNVDDWGKKKLAYKVKKNEFGYYLIFDIELEAAKTTELLREISLMEEIIRQLMTKKEENPAHAHADVAGEGQDEKRANEMGEDLHKVIHNDPDTHGAKEAE